ncbi:MAG: hypothetical protein NTZ42_04055 [Candidatus Gribaldobacteria bacterium]|nr:hypothetical protein [Candidatus Gribaldobacteria bacterium]
MKVKNCIYLFAILSMVLMIGCGSDTNTPTVSESNDGQAMLAPNVCYSEAQINSLILAAAAKDVGNTKAGQCKVWVNNIVYSSTKISLPAMDSYYTWASSTFARIIWQVKFACVPSFSTALKPGQIMQIQWQSTYMNGGPHTIILQSVSPTSISYYEANAGPAVRLWTTSIARWQQIAGAWTVYQVKSY